MVLDAMSRILVAGYADQTDNYCLALRSVGLQPIVSLAPPSYAAEYDGLLLPGGSDIAPSLFREPINDARNIDIQLDKRQLALLSYFAANKKPVLGICKGLQLMNIFFGGSLFQDLPCAKRHAWNGADRIHPVTSLHGSFTDILYGQSMITNSAHHQAIAVPGENILIVQQSEDCIAEAIVHTHLPMIALQWHPERMCLAHKRTDTADGLAVFAYWKSLIAHSDSS